MIDVWLVTSEGPCGIAEHSAYLREAVAGADSEIQLRGNPASLDPEWFFSTTLAPIPQIVHLNYHAALHSRWTPAHVGELLERGIHVVITYHDTGVPNSPQCLALYEATQAITRGHGAFVVHEPCADLPHAHYWRQGIPDWTLAWKYPDPRRPRVGSVGFPFAWKNFDLLCEAAALAGWSVELIAPGATDEQCVQWERLSNHRVFIKRTFISREEVLARLVGCDATAFLYHCHNTGTSGAIRQGIAARKPVIASKFPFGRQFRDLQEDDLGRRVIRWIEPNLDQVVEALSRTIIAPMDAGIVRLAERDSWARLGQKYAQLYREVVR